VIFLFSFKLYCFQLPEVTLHFSFFVSTIKKWWELETLEHILEDLFGENCYSGCKGIPDNFTFLEEVLLLVWLGTSIFDYQF